MVDLTGLCSSAPSQMSKWRIRQLQHAAAEVLRKVNAVQRFTAAQAGPARQQHEGSRCTRRTRVTAAAHHSVNQQLVRHLCKTQQHNRRRQQQQASWAGRRQTGSCRVPLVGMTLCLVG